MRHVFIIGSKGIPANYGGYETFVEKLTENRVSDEIKYHVACAVDSTDEIGEFEYNGAHCFKILRRPIGAAKAIFYDVDALKWCVKYIEQQHIEHPIVYVLACRIGPFFNRYVRLIHKLGGSVFVNPDGHEWKRAKWSAPVRAYWKLSERLMVKKADLLVCDNRKIEEYIQDEYEKYSPETTFLAYGTDLQRSSLSRDDAEVTAWFDKYNVRFQDYYLVVGRFVAENNYETMIKEFMCSGTRKDLVIVTNVEMNKFYDKLLKETHFDRDVRVKFVGTVYDQPLLKFIRENAYGYIHGHEVGGTNPSLLEALSSTPLNLLIDVGFNRDVARDAALYWTKEKGSFTRCIERADNMAFEDRGLYASRAQSIVGKEYAWPTIVSHYERLFEDFEQGTGDRMRKNILYLHAGAEMYGSDKVLLQLVTNLDSQRYRGIVILPEHGILEEVLRQKGIDVSVIEYPILRRRYFTLSGIAQYIWPFAVWCGWGWLYGDGG